MTQPGPNPSDARIVETMIKLARAVRSRRVIVAGRNSAAIFFDLYRRGYSHVATTATCGVPSGQYDVAFVTWSEHSVRALETTLDWLVHFLCPAGILTVWIDAHEPMLNRKLRLTLDRLGFRIEAGTSCENGVAIAARRIEANSAAKAA